MKDHRGGTSGRLDNFTAGCLAICRHAYVVQSHTLYFRGWAYYLFTAVWQGQMAAEMTYRSPLCRHDEESQEVTVAVKYPPAALPSTESFIRLVIEK